MIRESLGRIGPFIVGALVAYILIPTDPVAYPEVIVPAARIIEREPPARAPTIVERIRFVSVPPRQVAMAPGGAADDVTTFCRPMTISRTDTLEVPVKPMLLLRSGVYAERPIWNPLAKDQLLLTGPTSFGDLVAADYGVRGGFDFRTNGDSVLVRYPRGALLRDVIEVGAMLYTAIDLVSLLTSRD